MPLGLVIAYAAVAVVARFLTPVLATKEQEATTTAELSGLEGVVISRQVTPEFGEIRIRDRSGHVLRLPCRLVPGHPTVQEGQSVVVVGKEGAWLKVVPFDVDPPRLKSASKTTEKG
jgi:membrane protein implicated in regulation of membrane protease activity